MVYLAIGLALPLLPLRVCQGLGTFVVVLVNPKICVLRLRVIA
jgi:hypothetical protein